MDCAKPRYGLDRVDGGEVRCAIEGTERKCARIQIGLDRGREIR